MLGIADLDTWVGGIFRGPLLRWRQRRSGFWGGIGI